tara:strand:- start:1300 stop:1518 length:219 start_codon:yes stop_codon:yes gene_type:complete
VHDTEDVKVAYNSSTSKWELSTGQGASGWPSSGSVEYSSDEHTSASNDPWNAGWTDASSSMGYTITLTQGTS